MKEKILESGGDVKGLGVTAGRYNALTLLL